jgi:glyoxylase-like metal-dependent hydrolase (beta-lactamase superfamily II)
MISLSGRVSIARHRIGSMGTPFCQLSNHIWALPPDPATDRPVLGAVIGQQATLVIDAGNSPAHAQLLLAGLAQVASAPLCAVVLTHWHWDHVFGASAWAAPLVAHAETKRRIEALATLAWDDAALDQRVADGTEIAFCRDMFKAEWPDRTQLHIRPPDVSFDSGLEFDLGGVMCQARHVGGDHSADSTVVYIPEDGVVFLGDCLCEDLYHQPPNYTVGKLFPLLDTVLSFDAKAYVPAHDPAPMSRAEMTALAERLKFIGRLVERLGGRREDILRQLPAADSALDEDNRAVVEAFLAGLPSKTAP